MNILLFYHAGQTYTNTVFEHVSAFARHSRHNYFYWHQDNQEPPDVDLTKFDAVVIHYCLRLPYNQIPDNTARALSSFHGLKVVFIQDDYDHTRRAWDWIRRLGVHLVFTVVPERQIARIYPPTELPGVRLISNLTGYVPGELERGRSAVPLAMRKVVVGYRARELSLRYGQLGLDKVNIGKMVKAYCASRSIPEDIQWSENSRIYGARWYEFLGSCRAMLGSESGCNVFDWDGVLDDEIDRYRASHPGANEDEVYREVIAHHELPGVMNQVSPRVFECVASRTALMLFEGGYSGVVEPWTHYIPLKKDGSNLDEAFAYLRDDAFVEDMTARAWNDLIASGRYSYPTFMRRVDTEIELEAKRLRDQGQGGVTIQATPPPELSSRLTAEPIRKAPPGLMLSLLVQAWGALPVWARSLLRPIIDALRRKMRGMFRVV